jgi:hypothetical protein
LFELECVAAAGLAQSVLSTLRVHCSDPRSGAFGTRCEGL